MTSKDEKRERLFTMLELAEDWQVSPRTVKREIERGELRATQVGRQIRIHPRDKADYEKKNRR